MRDKSLVRDGERLDDIPYRDTSSYVKKVLVTRDLYHRLYPGLCAGSPS